MSIALPPTSDSRNFMNLLPEEKIVSVICNNCVNNLVCKYHVQFFVRSTYLAACKVCKYKAKETVKIFCIDNY